MDTKEKRLKKIRGVMNLLTEKECREALDGLRILERYENFKKWNGQVAPQVKADVIEQLIREHFKLVTKYDLALNELVEMEMKFNNPPLEWEELKEGMLIWDNKRKSWIEIDKTWKGIKQFVVCWVIGWDLQQTFEFEPNRFYRKEVSQ